MKNTKIKFRRGAKSNLPELSYGEPAFVSDEKELYIGTQSGNIKLTNTKEVNTIKGQVTELKTETTNIKQNAQMYKMTKDDGEIKYITENNLNMLDLKPGNYSCVASRFTNPPIPGYTGYIDISIRQNSNSEGIRKIITVHYIYSERIFIGQKHHSYDYIEWKEIEFKGSNGCYSQPFYEREVEEMYKKIINVQTEDTKSIGFITDTHYIKNTRGVYGMNALRHIDQIVNFGNGILDCIIHGGDAINGKGNKNELITELMDINSHLLKSNIPTFLCKGNHDYGSWKVDNSNNKNYDNNIISPLTWNKLITSKYINKYNFIGDDNNKGCGYAYYDFKDVKLRIIALDTSDHVKEHITDNQGNVTIKTTNFCISQKQMDWLVNKALNLPETSGWSVVVFSHIPLYKPYDINLSASVRNGSLVHNTLKAFKNSTSYIGKGTEGASYAINVSCDFTGTSHKFIGYIGGHHHRDDIAEKEFKYIVCNSSTVREREATNESEENGVFIRPLGTVDEDSWSVFTIDTKLRKLYLHRFGANKGFEQTIDF